jgi:hypothetical protein
MLADLAGFWRTSSLELKQRFQTTVYPTGLPFDGENLGTAETAPIFKYLRDFQAPEEQMVSPRGPDALWIPIEGWFLADGPRRGSPLN